MHEERKKARDRRERAPGAAGAAGDEATGQVPTGRTPNPAAEKAKKESGEGPTRGVDEREE